MNNEELSDSGVLLPKCSCHTLRHTFATRMCEAGVNIKALQAIMGHNDIKTTLNIYTDATEKFKSEAINQFAEHFNLTTSLPQNQLDVFTDM